eukprot:TRINITY_DN7986_c0_g1_i1.p1 TRINITY_DN7986_c0_g1~~TRINITY_DN7986_c0_g1_i1.p1  ORF type:complete len:723 (+),score=93.85 TRINITY_DN7986_c0_g1_i1:105-2273(+)
MGRLLVVVNKLPVMVVDGAVIASSGGLVPALKEAATGLSEMRMLWVGYTTPETTENGDLSLTSEDYHPVSINKDLYNEHYNVFSNAILWPVFHYNEATDFPPESYNAYHEVNKIFCKELVNMYQEGDIIWVHDYHLLLLPSMLREAGITGKIGFFLHIPFPSSEVYRKIPWRKQLLRGILGADVVGFHTHDYCQHFANTVVRVLNIETKAYQISVGERKVKMGVYPVGSNLTRLDAALSSVDVSDKILELKRRFANTKLIVGVDRMDYIKGLPQKLMAFEKLLEDNPSLVGNVALVQIAVPSRDTVQSYQELRKEVEALVGRINAKYSTISYSAVHYKYDSVPFTDLVALYSIADVFLVTSLRDGMNVTCQEYVACQEQNKGVLILSEFAGAARCLANAIRINPWDIDSVAQKIKFALTMGAEERADRHRSLYEYVQSHGAAPWGRSFVSDLLASDNLDEALQRKSLVSQAIQLSKSLKASNGSKLLLLTTAMITNGLITQQIIDQMQEGGFSVAVFDSSSSSSITRKLEECKITIEKVQILSEYGCFWKPMHEGKDSWERLVSPSVSHEWYDKVRNVLAHYELSTPGSSVDSTQEYVLSWSWDDCDVFFGESQAQECYVQLANMMSTAQNQAYTVDIDPISSILEIYPKSLPEQSINQLFKTIGPQQLVVFIGYAPPDSILSQTSVFSLLMHPTVAEHNRSISLPSTEIEQVLGRLVDVSE